MRRSSFLRRLAVALFAPFAFRSGPDVPNDMHIPSENLLGVEPVTFTAPDSLVASGGLCAPLAPYYEIPVNSVNPIRDSLPSYKAERGGISFAKPACEHRPIGGECIYCGELIPITR